MPLTETKLSNAWPRCRPLIDAALATSPGLEKITDVERLLANGTYTLWHSDRSAAVTEISVYAQKKVLTVVHGGGNLSELIDELEPAMCSFARRSGCHAIMGTGRRGWERVCKPRGYQFGYVAMFKELP